MKKRTFDLVKVNLLPLVIDLYVLLALRCEKGIMKSARFLSIHTFPSGERLEYCLSKAFMITTRNFVVSPISWLKLSRSCILATFPFGITVRRSSQFLYWKCANVCRSTGVLTLSATVLKLSTISSA